MPTPESQHRDAPVESVRGGRRGGGCAGRPAAVGRDHLGVGQLLREPRGEDAGAAAEVDGAARVEVVDVERLDEGARADVVAGARKRGAVGADREVEVVDARLARVAQLAGGLRLGAHDRAGLAQAPRRPHLPEVARELLVHRAGEVLLAAGEHERDARRRLRRDRLGDLVELGERLRQQAEHELRVGKQLAVELGALGDRRVLEHLAGLGAHAGVAEDPDARRGLARQLGERAGKVELRILDDRDRAREVFEPGDPELVQDDVNFRCAHLSILSCRGPRRASSQSVNWAP
jgi:hypothetical protein